MMMDLISIVKQFNPDLDGEEAKEVAFIAATIEFFKKEYGGQLCDISFNKKGISYATDIVKKQKSREMHDEIKTVMFPVAAGRLPEPNIDNYQIIKKIYNALSEAGLFLDKPKTPAPPHHLEFDDDD